MSTGKPPKSLQRVSMIAISLAVFPMLLALSAISFFLLQKQLTDNFSQLQIQTETDLIEMVKIADNGYLMLEKALDDRIKNIFEDLLTQYAVNNNHIGRLNLDSLKTKHGDNLDLYIISADGVIVATTYAEDLGIDFKRYPGFYTWLQRILTTGAYQSDRIVREMSAGKLRKYSYMPTPDKNYILEVGLTANDFNHFTQGLDNDALAGRLKKVNPALLSVTFFHFSGDIRTATGIMRPKGPNVYAEVGHILQTASDKRYLTRANGLVKRYTYIDLANPDYPTDTSICVELTFNEASVNQALFNLAFWQVTASLAITVMLGVVVWFTIRRISQPIHSLIADIDRIASGDLDHRVSEESTSELIILERSTNRLIDTMKTYISTIAASERQLSEYNENLEKQVSSRTQSLLESTKQAALGNLVCGMAHELNTPIGITTTSLSFMADQLHEFHNKFESNHMTRSDLADFLALCRESLAMGQKSNDRAAKLVSKFKDISMEQDTEPAVQLNLLDTISSLLDLHADELAGYGVHPVIDCAPDISINSFPLGLMKVFDNLIHNALLHSFSLGKGNQLRIAVERQPNSLLIMVQDNGAGLAPEVKPHLFEPFVTTARSRGCTGLGLHMVYTLVVQKFKGTIAAEETPGGGTTMRMTLPVGS